MLSIFVYWWICVSLTFVIVIDTIVNIYGLVNINKEYDIPFDLWEDSGDID